jgi:hypothetical protein
MIKFRKLRWTGHVVRMEDGRSALKMLTDNLRKKTFRKA